MANESLSKKLVWFVVFRFKLREIEEKYSKHSVAVSEAGMCKNRKHVAKLR